jgi:hypothetical protein
MNQELHQGMLDAALEISARRAKALREIKSLLEDDRDLEALSLMRSFLGVKKEAKTSRVIRASFPRPAPEK